MLGFLVPVEEEEDAERVQYLGNRYGQLKVTPQALKDR